MWRDTNVFVRRVETWELSLIRSIRLDSCIACSRGLCHWNKIDICWLIIIGLYLIKNLALANSLFCIKNVQLKRPKSKKTSQTIVNALESDLVPTILESCNAVGGRATFSAETPEEIVLQIAARHYGYLCVWVKNDEPWSTWEDKINVTLSSIASTPLVSCTMVGVGVSPS